MNTIKKNFILLFAFGLPFFSPLLFGQNNANNSSEAHPNQYFIKLCPGVSEMSVNTMLAELNSVELWKNDEIGLRIWAVKTFPYACPDSGEEISDIGEHVKRAKKKSDINDAELDRTNHIPHAQPNNNYDYFDDLSIFAPQGANPITISILDSGISDLSGANTGDYNFALTTYTGYDYIGNDTDPNDENGHGTHIAGLIHHIVHKESGNSNINFDIRKTHDSNGYGHISNLVTATVDAVQAGADIINMSFSYYDLPTDTVINPLELAIDYARQNGVLVVASAGNNGSNNDGGELAPLPASLLSDNIISVQSNNAQNQLSSFSNFGFHSVDLSILGEDIPGPDLNGNLKQASGTSFSTAIVTALAAVLGTRQNSFNYCETKCVLTSSSTYFSNMSGLNQANGIINFQEALNNPSANCGTSCAGVDPLVEVDCGLNCPPETNEMNICAEKEETITSTLLVYDQENDAVSFAPDPVYGPFKGSVAIHPDGTFLYTSNNGDPDMFVYRVCDGQVAMGVTGGTESNGSQTVRSRIFGANDDAEENAANGQMYHGSSDLEMIDDSDYIGRQVVGLRFNNIYVPQGATIESASIRFTAKYNESGSTSLVFRGHDADDAPVFSSANGNISTRPVTSAFSTWNDIPAWSSGTVYGSPNLANIIQEIVDRGGWTSGNSIAIIVSGSGERSAWSYEGYASQAPELEVTFSGGSGGFSSAQLCSDGCNQGIVYINGINCKQAAPPVYSSSNSGNGNGNGGGEVISKYISSRISDSRDDAEEDVGATPGPVFLSSWDLEMVYDPGWAYGDQTTGMRFNGINIPQGATIQSAKITFRANSSQSGASNIQFWGQAADNASAFTTANFDISSRPKTSASFAWNNVPAWTTGAYYATPDLSAIIQEIINRSGWSAGNSLAIITTGAGKRDAYSYDGSISAAPLLEITYVDDANVGSGGSGAVENIDCCAETGEKPRILVLKYTGAGCEATSHNQQEDKVYCSGDPQSAPLVYVTATDGGGTTYLSDLPVALDERFEVDAADAGDSKLKNDLTFHLKDAQGNILQTIEFHASCSQPLGVGDQFGAVLVEGYLAENGALCGAAPVNIDEDWVDCCAETGEKPQILVMKYTGGSCDATSHLQDAGKVECSGDPQNAPFVYVTVTDGGNKTYLLDRQVALGESFDVDALNVGDSRLKNDLTIYLKDAQGNTLQAIEFHTSCSQPLGVSNQFGALRVEGYLAEDGALCGAAPISQLCAMTVGCVCADKRSVVGFMYTGANATNVSAYAKSGEGDFMGFYEQVEPGDFIAFSSRYRNKDGLDKIYLVKEGEEEIEVLIKCEEVFLGNIYGDFVAVYQVDKEGHVCSIPYSACIEININCGVEEAPAIIEEVPDLYVPLTTERQTYDFGVQEKSVYLYPNPAKSFVYLNLADFAGQAVDIAIYDSVSRLIKQVRLEEVGATSAKINLNDLMDGMYTVAVQAEGEPPVLKKLVIAR